MSREPVENTWKGGPYPPPYKAERIMLSNIQVDQSDFLTALSNLVIKTKHKGWHLLEVCHVHGQQTRPNEDENPPRPLFALLSVPLLFRHSSLVEAYDFIINGCYWLPLE